MNYDCRTCNDTGSCCPCCRAPVAECRFGGMPATSTIALPCPDCLKLPERRDR